jgi:hypothetical protein
LCGNGCVPHTVEIAFRVLAGRLGINFSEWVVTP